MNDALTFHKMHSLGNDFMLVDVEAERWTPDAKMVRAWGDRRRGIGFDQLLLVYARGDETRCDIYNSDGSTAQQCGNGARCVAAYLRARGRVGERFDFVIGEQTVSAAIDGERVSVWLAAPSFDMDEIGFTGAHENGECVLSTSAGALKFGLVSMGNPHAVVDLAQAKLSVRDIGSEVQAKSEFTRGVNVGFMCVQRRDRVHLRVFERGCGETPACGSGACAAVAIGQRRGLLDEAVEVMLPGGALEIAWRGDGERVRMTGPTARVYSGRIDCPTSSSSQENAKGRAET